MAFKIDTYDFINEKREMFCRVQIIREIQKQNDPISIFFCFQIMTPNWILCDVAVSLTFLYKVFVIYVCSVVCS